MKLSKADFKDYTLMFEDFSIKSKTDGSIYTASKETLNKICNALGYGKYSNVEILFKYGSAVDLNLDRIKNLSLFLDTDRNNFIVCTDQTYDWYKLVIQEFSLPNLQQQSQVEEGGWVELIYLDLGTRCTLAADFNFIKETFELYLIKSSGNISLLQKASMKNDTGDAAILHQTLINLHTYVDTDFLDRRPESEVSYRELAELLLKTGLLKKKGNRICVVQSGMVVKFHDSELDLDSFVDELAFYGEKISEFFVKGVAFSDVCAIIQAETIKKCEPYRNFYPFLQKYL